MCSSELLHVLLQSLVTDDGSLAFPMFFRFFIPDEKLTILTVTLRFVPRNFDNRKDAVAFAEDTVHLLQGAVSGLRVEEPDNGEDGSISVVSYQPR